MTKVCLRRSSTRRLRFVCDGAVTLAVQVGLDIGPSCGGIARILDKANGGDIPKPDAVKLRAGNLARSPVRLYDWSRRHAHPDADMEILREDLTDRLILAYAERLC